MDEKIVQKIIEGGSNSIENLNIFIEKAEKLFAFPELNEKNLRRELWKSIYTLASTTSDDILKARCFVAFRILSREKTELDELVKDNNLVQLIQTSCGLISTGSDITEINKGIAVEASKCLCNLVFNSKIVAKECCENDVLFGLVNRMKMYKDPSFPSEMKFFDVKLIFMITALCPAVRNSLRDEKHAVDRLVEILQSIYDETGRQNGRSKGLDDRSVDLASEILKALFNLTLQIENDIKEVEKCNELVKLLRKYLSIDVDSQEKKLIFHNNIINLLTNMPSKCFIELVPKFDSNTSKNKVEFKGHDVSALFEVLELLRKKLANNGTVSEQHEILSPISTVLYKGACADRIIRKYLRSEILPPLRDVHNRPEEGTTLRNSLCRLLTTPMTQLRDIVSEFLFVLCKKSVNRMIKYTGYGNAAGLFAQRGLLGGREDEGAIEFSSDSEDSETEEYAEHKHGIDPVVGCYKAPHPDAMADMTEEQKEYEAMKLVQLMDEMTKSGTIKPCRVGKDGKPEPIEHVLQLQETIKNQRNKMIDSDSD